MQKVMITKYLLYPIALNVLCIPHELLNQGSILYKPSVFAALVLFKNLYYIFDTFSLSVKKEFVRKGLIVS